MENSIKITLIKHDINVKDLTPEQFSFMLCNDFYEAIEKHKNLVEEKWEDSVDKRAAEVRDRAYKYAHAKWVRESRISSYIETEVGKEYWKNCPEYYVISYFDFDYSFGTSNAVRSFSKSNIDNFNKTVFASLYKEITSNSYYKKFFDAATGWVFECEVEEDSYRYIGRPEIRFILPEELEEEIKANDKKLSDDINEFYRTCRYCGD